MTPNKVDDTTRDVAQGLANLRATVEEQQTQLTGLREFRDETRTQLTEIQETLR